MEVSSVQVIEERILRSQGTLKDARLEWARTGKWKAFSTARTKKESRSRTVCIVSAIFWHGENANYETFLVKDTRYILKKYRNAAPSLILHLHPTHFRFDQQDGSFSYNSPMKIILEHIKLSTVPHDLMEEFAAAGIKFYEGRLDTIRFTGY